MSFFPIHFSILQVLLYLLMKCFQPAHGILPNATNDTMISYRGSDVVMTQDLGFVPYFALFLLLISDWFVLFKIYEVSSPYPAQKTHFFFGGGGLITCQERMVYGTSSTHGYSGFYFLKIPMSNPDVFQFLQYRVWLYPTF